MHAQQFENYVNYAGSKTIDFIKILTISFENYVNYAGSKTINLCQKKKLLFENYVNYAGSKTSWLSSLSFIGLRTM